MAVDVFSVPVFLITFRETLETVIIVSVLLAFLKQTLDGPNADRRTYKTLRNQVWLGTALGLVICLIVAAVLIAIFYTVGTDHWATSEYYVEGAFAIFAAVVITVMGAALLRVGKMQEKWRVKLAKAIEQPIVKTAGRGQWFARVCEKYAMFLLPFITVLREGVEAIMFIAGVSFSSSATEIPLAAVVGLIVGCLVGFILYKSGTSTQLQFFLVASTCLLYLVAAGLFSRGVWYFEEQQWNIEIGGEAAEQGAGPGSYDIDKSVWHVNCCSPEVPNSGGWGIFNAILGWTNSATYGSVISYNVYWIFVMAGFITLRYREVKGHWPLMKAKAGKKVEESHPGFDSAEEQIQGQESGPKTVSEPTAHPVAA